MGECLISRRGGESYELPVLNASYPQNVTIVESSSGKATFQIVIDTPGKPAEYTYQWYVNGTAVSGATGTTYTKSGLTAAASYTVYCEVTNKAGIAISRVATLTVKSSQPVFTYTGTKPTVASDGGYNWKMTFSGSCTVNFSSLGSSNTVDVFCVGGGGGGSTSRGGGGGGYTSTATKTISLNTTYTVTVGAGGGAGINGGQTSAFGVSASGGYAGSELNGGRGGSGGGGGGCGYGVQGYDAGGNGGSNGGNGDSGQSYSDSYGAHHGGSGGAGQGYTTGAFNSSSNDQYSHGGGGASNFSSWGSSGSGTGRTGGGGSGYSGSGGNGIVIIRNQR